MKAEVDTKRFAQALSIAGKISGKHLTLPVLNCVLIEAKDKKLFVRATNLDVGVEITVPASVDENGIVAVPSATITGVLSGSHQGVAVLEKSGDNLKMTYGGNKSLIRAFPHDDFPTIPRLHDGVSVKLEARGLLEGIRSVWYSASTSTIKPELASIYIYNKDGNILCVATDSFRLAEKVVPVQVSKFESFLLPARNSVELVRILEHVEKEVTVTVDTNQFSCEAEGVYFTSRLIDGSFPDYEKIIPKEFVTEVTVLREDVVNALKKTSIFTDRFNQLTVTAQTKKKTLTFISKNDDVGETTETIPATVSGEDITINFNQKYITDSFNSISSDSITLSLAGIGRPMVIKGVGDSSFMYLVMPMNK